MKSLHMEPPASECKLKFNKKQINDKLCDIIIYEWTKLSLWMN